MSLKDFVRQIVSGVVEVGGFDLEIREESVLAVVGHVEPTSENVMVDKHRCLLQSDDAPLHCDFVSKASSFPRRRPGIQM